MNPEQEITLWVGATRYYCGRMTYAVSTFVEMLIGAWDSLHENTKSIIKRDMEEEFTRDDRYRENGYTSRLPLGHDCDRASWELLREKYNKDV